MGQYAAVVVLERILSFALGRLYFKELRLHPSMFAIPYAQELR
jgi:hypothetical protein